MVVTIFQQYQNDHNGIMYENIIHLGTPITIDDDE